MKNSVGKWKMASAKSLEDMLSSEVDESAVNAIVGSLESQLSSPNIHIPSQDIQSGAVATNHIGSLSVSDGGLQRLHDAQKHGVPVGNLNQPQGNAVSNTAKLLTSNSQGVGINSVVSAQSSTSNTVMVTLASALPASGYMTGTVQQALLNTAAGIAVTRPMNNSDIKIVYSQQQQSGAHFNSSNINNSVIQTQRSNLKVAVQNGNVGNISNLNIVRPGQPVNSGLTTVVTPVITGSPATSTGVMSAMQNLANVAAQQQPLIISSASSTVVGSGPHYTLQAQQQAQLNAKLVAQRMTVREQLEQNKQVDKLMGKTMGKDQESGTPPNTTALIMHPHSPAQQTCNMIQVSSATPTVITMSKPSQSQSGQPVNVVTQMVSNPNLIPGVQIVNMNPGRQVGHNMGGQKPLAPRMVIGNPVRIASANSQQLIGRPGAPGVQNTITLQPGMVRGALLFKTENGQFQVLNVAQGPTSQGGSLPGGTTYRLQSVPGHQGGMRTLAPQQMTVTLPVSVASAVKPGQQVHSHSKGPGGTSMLGTVLQHGQGMNVVTTVGSHLHSATVTSTAPGTIQPVSHHGMAIKVAGNIVTTGSSVTQPLTIHTSTANSQSATTPSQMSPNTAKKKCKNFLSTLIRLATDQPEQVATNVKNLIQGLIDGAIQPEDFTNQLQKELNSSPQPCLVPFLKKSLPYLRHSLMTKELTIEGVRPPAPGAVILPPTPTAIPPIQVWDRKNHFITQTRPQTPTQQNTVRFVGQVTNSALTAQLTQPVPSLITHQRIVTPRLPVVVTQNKSLLVTSLSNTKQASMNLNQTTNAMSSSIGTTVTAGAANASILTSAAIMSPATVGALQAKSATTSRVFTTISSSSASAKEKEKRNFASLSSRDDDDINDVAAMGGVNLVEESQRILASNAEIVGTQIRSCKDENFLYTSPLQKRISNIASKLGIEDPSPDIVSLISHATQERLKSLVEKLGVIAEHRLENIKNDPRFEITQDVKGQLKFLEELDRLEKKRHEEQEREILLRAAKSRSKLEDPEQLKLKQKAKEMQRAELEEMRQREANATALLAIGTRKRQKLEAGLAGQAQIGATGASNSGSSSSKTPIRPRVKRVNLRDLLFLMEQERETVRTPFLYKSYFK